MPALEVILVDELDPFVNPIGAKGIGEIGITGVGAAIANAVYHATGRRIRDLPITLEKLLQVCTPCVAKLCQCALDRSFAMSMVRTFLTLAVLIAGSTAVAEPPARPPAEKKTDKPAPATKPAAKPNGNASASSDTLPGDVAKKFEDFFDKLTSIVVDNKDDCAKMAAGVNALVDANQALIKQINDAKDQRKSLPQSSKDKIAKKSAEELAPAMMKKCSNDRAVMSAFVRIKPTPPPSPAERSERVKEKIEREKAEKAEK